MASWKKIIVSGSKADLNEVTASGGIITAGDLTVSGGDITLGTTSIFSGGNTTSLNNIDAIDATTEATIEAALDTLSNVTTVGTLDAGAISSGFGNIDNGTSTLNTGNATVDNLTNASAVADSHITGSFTGSFIGDGSGLSGVTAAVDIDSLSAAAIAQTDLLIFSDAGTESKITFSDFEDSIFGNVSGDATIAAGGALTIAADSVEGTMLNTNAADTTTLELSSDTLSVLKVPNALTVDNATIQLDSGTTFDGSGAKTISIKDGGVDADALAAAVAGAGLTGGGGSALAVGAGTGVTVNANDIAIGQAVATDSNVTFANLTLSGDLTVNGTTTSVNSTNLLVEDKFILLNSGSATGDGGIIVQSGSTFSGSAFAWDDSADRWAVQFDTGLGSGQTAVAPEAYASLYVQNAYTGSSTYTVKGNIRVDDSDESIWIYS
jgi:hypothetical protein